MDKSNGVRSLYLSVERCCAYHILSLVANTYMVGIHVYVIDVLEELIWDFECFDTLYLRTKEVSSDYSWSIMYSSNSSFTLLCTVEMVSSASSDPTVHIVVIWYWVSVSPNHLLAVCSIFRPFLMKKWINFMKHLLVSP